MKKISIDAARAFLMGKKFKRGNTEVRVLPNVSVLLLHGNEIAYQYNDPERTLSVTNAGWFSNTTKERLNAVEGVRINQKNWVWYLNGEAWDGELKDVKQ
jgi:hypothetical protein